MSDEQQGDGLIEPAYTDPERQPRVTNALIGLYAGAWFAELLTGGLWRELGILTPAFLWETEFGLVQLLAPLIMHAGVLDIMVNSVLLILLGSTAEQLYGRRRVLLVYVASGIAGIVSSAALMPNDAAVAASAGVLGIAGLLIGFVALRRGLLPANAETRLSIILGVGVTLELLIGPVEPFLNVAMQLGGLLCGLLLSLAIEPKVPARHAPELGVVAAAVVVAAIGGLFAMSARTVIGTLPHALIEATYYGQMDDFSRGIGILEGTLTGDQAGSTALVWRPDALNALAWFYVETGRKLDRGIALSEESNQLRPNRPAYLDTLGYLYAMSNRCAEAADAMGQAAELDGGYVRRRDEVARSCAAGDLRPNPDLPVDPLPSKANEPGKKKKTKSSDSIHASGLRHWSEQGAEAAS